ETNQKKLRPSLSRTRSIDMIQKHPPHKIFKVCFDKATYLITTTEENLDQRDYKKIKYWLKIAQGAAKSSKKENEFIQFLDSLKSPAKDQELTKLLTELQTVDNNLTSSTKVEKEIEKNTTPSPSSPVT